MKEAMYERYIRDFNFDTNHHSLHNKGVTGINDIPFPHIFDLEDFGHRGYPHYVCIYKQ